MNIERPLTDADQMQHAGALVLVVDDSRAQRVLLARSLTSWGYNVVEAASGEDALELCRQDSGIALVISDWMMPGMSGVEFCRAYHDLRGDRPSYFILLTAQTDREMLADGLENGADDFLSKPFNTVELRARLRAGERVVSAQAELTRRNAQLGDALDELREINAAIDRDLAEAQKLQGSLVPERHRKFGSTAVSLLYRPSGRVGGDLVGMFEAGVDQLGVFSVDVAGHGIASALMTARIAGHLSAASPERNIALKRTGRGKVLLADPEEVAARMNEVLLTEWESEQYFTMALAGIDLRTGRVIVSHAGHPSTAILRASGGIEFVESFGMPIGLIEAAEFAQTEARLNPGDRMLLYSDGITECPDPDERLLDEAGLARLMRELAELSGPAFLDGIYEGLTDWKGDEEFPDDISAILVEFDVD